MSLDLTVAEHANAWAAHHDGWEDVARAYASVSELLFVAGVVLLGLAGLVLRRRHLLAASVLAVLAAGGGLVVASVAGKLIGRPRPFAAHPHQIHAFLAHAPDPGFPSDHATAAFAIGTVLVLLAAVALAVSRVLVGIHYPGDVIAGALLGALAGVVVVLLARRLVPAATEATAGAPRREKLSAVRG
jgi:undecaprenyl-diphosphatase